MSTLMSFTLALYSLHVNSDEDDTCCRSVYVNSDEDDTCCRSVLVVVVAPVVTVVV
ncbi:hypothetical protein F2Q68_00024440 [Brassica cretica]|nr:hypothetical protein F2Q68_00024440 [Brassica cretica]